MYIYLIWWCNVDPVDICTHYYETFYIERSVFHSPLINMPLCMCVGFFSEISAFPMSWFFLMKKSEIMNTTIK